MPVANIQTIATINITLGCNRVAVATLTNAPAPTKNNPTATFKPNTIFGLNFNGLLGSSPDRLQTINNSGSNTITKS